MTTITVFLADDHAVVRDGLRAFLDAQDDIEVVGEAGDGREALEQIEELQPDIAVLDIAMPKRNGIETTREIKVLFPLIGVVILSMHSTMEHVFRALQAGACGFVMKESAGTELVRAVRAVHNGHRYLSQKISDQMIEEYMRWRGSLEDQSPLACLSPREREILQLTVEGKSTEDIAADLAVANTTVSTYRSRMMKKLEIEDIANLVKYAVRQGLTPLD